MAKRNNVFNMRTSFIEVYGDYLPKSNIQEVEIITELVLFFSLRAHFLSLTEYTHGKDIKCRQEATDLLQYN